MVIAMSIPMAILLCKSCLVNGGGATPPTFVVGAIFYELCSKTIGNHSETGGLHSNMLYLRHMVVRIETALGTVRK